MTQREMRLTLAKIGALCAGAKMHLDYARTFTAEDKARAINEAQELIDRIREIAERHCKTNKEYEI